MPYICHFFVPWSSHMVNPSHRANETQQRRRVKCQSGRGFLVGGFNLPLWKMMEFVSSDDDIPNWMESHNLFMFQSPPTSFVFSRIWTGRMLGEWLDDGDGDFREKNHVNIGSHETCDGFRPETSRNTPKKTAEVPEVTATRRGHFWHFAN